MTQPPPPTQPATPPTASADVALLRLLAGGTVPAPQRPETR